VSSPFESAAHTEIMDTPEACLIRYVLAWRARDWASMADQCQMTWRSVTIFPPDYLRARWAAFELIDYKIQGGVILTPTSHDLQLMIRYKYRKGDAVKRMLARVIREAAPYRPSEQGTWGVNPISLLRTWEPDHDLPSSFV